MAGGGAARGAASAPAGVGDRRRQLWSGCLVHSRQDDGVLDAEQLRDGRLDRVVRHRSVRCGKRAARRLWSEVARLGGRQRPGANQKEGSKPNAMHRVTTRHRARAHMPPVSPRRAGRGAHPGAHRQASTRPRPALLPLRLTSTTCDALVNGLGTHRRAHMGQAGGCLVRMCVSFCLRFSDLNASFVCFFSCRRAC